MLTYLASPYSSPDPAVREARYQAACQAAAEMIRAGKATFSPVCHSHPLCRFDLPGDWGFWGAIDRRFLEACDEVVVLKLDGWQESHGVQAEIEITRKLGKPVSFVALEELAEENPGRSRG